MRTLPTALFIMLACYSSFSVSEPLRFSYWDDATPPFAFVEKDTLQKGILKDLGEAIGAALKLPVEFVELPVLRVEEQLKLGKVDVTCLTSPIWRDDPDAYNWSPVLFEGSDRFLVRKELQHKIQSFSDLKGLTIGIYKNYVYHAKIMSMIASGEVKAIKLSGVEHGIKLLKLGRLDALIDFGMLLDYQIKTLNLSDQFALADKYADKYDLSCAYSKNMRVPVETMNTAISEIIDSGQLTDILARYQ